MEEVGVRFKNCEIYVPEVLVAARAMQAFEGLAYGRETTLDPLVSAGVLLTTAILGFGLAIYLFDWDRVNRARRHQRREHRTVLDHVDPEYETMPGWDVNIQRARAWSDSRLHATVEVVFGHAWCPARKPLPDGYAPVEFSRGRGGGPNHPRG